MSCDVVPKRDGFSSLLGTDEADALTVRRIYANRVRQIQTGGAMGAVSFTSDALGYIQTIAIEYDRPDGTKTVTWTMSTNSECFITGISEGVVT